MYTTTRHPIIVTSYSEFQYTAALAVYNIITSKYKQYL